MYYVCVYLKTFICAYPYVPKLTGWEKKRN